MEEERRPVAAPVWLKLVWMRPVRGSIELRQGIDVGAFELGELAVFENFAGDFVLDGEAFENIGGGGDGFALAVFDGGGELHYLEENLAELLG